MYKRIIIRRLCAKKIHYKTLDLFFIIENDINKNL